MPRGLWVQILSDVPRGFSSVGSERYSYKVEADSSTLSTLTKGINDGISDGLNDGVKCAYSPTSLLNWAR